MVSVFALRRLSACAFPRPSAIASAKFANSTVNQSQSVICNSNPVLVTPGIGAMIPRISRRAVKMPPTSTTNMTGLPIILRGLSFLNESMIARLTICAFQIACFFVFSIICFKRRGLLSLVFGLWFLVFGFWFLICGCYVQIAKTIRPLVMYKDQSPKAQDLCFSKRLSCIHQQVLHYRSQAQRRKERQ